MTDSTQKPRGIKKSLFSALDTIPSSAYFDFVSNGVNYRISLADMISEFGTTGTLEQLGAVTAYQLLNTVGTANQIRGLGEGPGITLSLNPGGEVQVEHNFTQDDTGAEILYDLTTDPKSRSLVAGAGISIGIQNGSIQISESDTPVSNKTVTVNSISDLPTASGNVITLEADTQYIQLNDLNIGTNRLVLQSNTVYSAADGTLIALTYTGTDPMFTATSVSSKIKDIILNFANAPLAAITGSGTELFQIINCRCLGKSGGTYTDLFASSMQNVYWVLTTDGLTYAGNNAVVSFFQNVGALSAGTFVDLGASTFDAFSFANSQGTLASGAVFITGASDSANVNAGGLATVTNTHATGAGTALSGVATDDALWEFSANNGINNSITSLLATHDAVTLTISAANTPVRVDSTWSFSHESRFTGAANGRFTYIGKGAHVDLNATITADIVTGVDKVTFYFYKNGVKEAGSAVQREFDSNDPGNIGMVWQIDLETDDYVEIWVENNDTNVNVEIVNAILSIAGA